MADRVVRGDKIGGMIPYLENIGSILKCIIIIIVIFNIKISHDNSLEG